MRDRSIGIFDSGVGGLNVLKACLDIMPSENYIYLSDAARMPYGTKSGAQITAAALDCADKLVCLDCKAIAVACNTATAVAIDRIRAKYPSVIIVGLEPAIKPCLAELGKNGYAVALVTEATGRSEKFKRLAATGNGKIVPVVAPSLAKAIEDNFGDFNAVRDYLFELLSPYRDAESVILGCSHYSYIAPLIKRFYANDIKIYDGASGEATRLKYCLALADMLGNGKGKESVRFIKTVKTPLEFKRGK